MSTIARGMAASFAPLPLIAPLPLVAALLLLAAPGVGHATAFKALAFEERLERAVDVFIGRVANVTTERRDDDPWTVVSITVDEWLLHDGTVTETGPFDVDLAFLGGSAAGVAPRQVAGLPGFAIGDRVLVASYGATSGAASPLVGVTQGLWREVDGVWRDDDDQALALDAAGRVHLAREGAPVSDWMPALREFLRALEDER